MICYLLCLIPCGVKVNGEYVGKASKNLTFIELSEGLIEFIPLSNSHLQTTYYFDENNPKSTQNIKIIDLYGGFLLIPSFDFSSDLDLHLVRIVVEGHIDYVMHSALEVELAFYHV